ncbi:MAG: methionine ABC transporter ATP-binding protein [Rhizobiales bacterium 65-9]|nr:MAG: methionine ABC transporter ATP-binding protein [Rhizobiales bacterium 65-9]
MGDVVLEVDNLSTVFELKAGVARPVNGVNFQLRRGEILGVVGESGSGKSVTGLSILGLIDPPGRIESGAIRLNGLDLTKIDESEMRRHRGRSVSMIFQDPMTTLNPVLTIGRQFFDVLRAHRNVGREEAMTIAEGALERVGIPAPRLRLSSYPHELSGGMRQRVCIAIALACGPDVIIADEPTTALDVTIQSQILNLVQTLVRQNDAALVWITHDLSVVAGLCDRVAVMYAGRIVEIGSVKEVLDRPRHPYTIGLINSIPGDAPPGGRLSQIPGGPPSPFRLPPGCAFAPRCAKAATICETNPPSLGGPEYSVRCHFPA